MSRSSQAHKQPLFFSSVWTQHLTDQILTEEGKKKTLKLITVSQTAQSNVRVTPSSNVPVRQRNSTPAQQRCLAQILELQVNLTSRWGTTPGEKHKKQRRTLLGQSNTAISGAADFCNNKRLEVKYMAFREPAAPICATETQLSKPFNQLKSNTKHFPDTSGVQCFSFQPNLWSPWS